MWPLPLGETEKGRGRLIETTMGWASEEIGRGEEAPDTDGGGGEAIHIRLLPLLHSSPSPPRLATGKGEEEGPPSLLPFFSSPILACSEEKGSPHSRRKGRRDTLASPSVGGGGIDGDKRCLGCERRGQHVCVCECVSPHDLTCAHVRAYVVVLHPCIYRPFACSPSGVGNTKEGRSRREKGLLWPRARNWPFPLPLSSLFPCALECGDRGGHNSREKKGFSFCRSLRK